MDPELEKFLKLASRGGREKPEEGNPLAIAPDAAQGTAQAVSQGVARGATLGTAPWLHENLFGPMGRGLADVAQIAQAPIEQGMAKVAEATGLDFLKPGPDQAIAATREAFKPQTGEQIASAVRANEQNFPVATEIGKAAGSALPAVGLGLGAGAAIPALAGGSTASLAGAGAASGGLTAGLTNVGENAISGINPFTAGGLAADTALGTAGGAAGGVLGKAIGRATDPAKDIAANFWKKLAPGTEKAFGDALEQAGQRGIKPTTGQVLEQAGGLLDDRGVAGAGRVLQEKTVRLADKTGNRPLVEAATEDVAKKTNKLYDTASKRLEGIAPGLEAGWEKGGAQGVGNLGVRGSEVLKQVNAGLPGKGDSPAAFQEARTILQAELDGFKPKLGKSGKETPTSRKVRTDLEKSIQRMDELSDRTLPASWREEPKLRGDLAHIEETGASAARPLPKAIKEPKGSSGFYGNVGAIASGAAGNIPGAIASLLINPVTSGVRSGAKAFANRGADEALNILLNDPELAVKMFGSRMLAKQAIAGMLAGQGIGPAAGLLAETPLARQMWD